MKFRLALILFPAALCMAQGNTSGKNELAFGLGGIPALSRNEVPSIDTGAGVAFQVNYGRRLLEHRPFALYGEVNMIANPLREVSGPVGSATRDFASLYLTVGVRVKFRPSARLSPFVAAGGGYADYEHSTMRLDGGANQASRELGRGVLDFGAGIDVRVWRFVALRGEARDYYTGSPDYNVPSITRGGQHNIVSAGAIVLRWH